APARHLLDRQAALEQLQRLEVVHRDQFCLEDGLPEAVVLFFAQGAVQVAADAAFLLPLPVAGGLEDDGAVDRLRVDDGRGRVVEVQLRGAGDALDLRRQRIGGERA